ncbi:MAG: TfoX/Sxy family protein [Antricoccus sp.]
MSKSKRADRSGERTSVKTAHRDELAARVRAAFSDRDVREVRMFGGLSFMIDGRMAVSVGREGDLLVRIDPTEHDQLLKMPGAQNAIMGADRPMGPGWITVQRTYLSISDQFSFWIRTALEFHAAQTNAPS